ncbi:fructose-6-phosphate aldolase [Zooshikella marina]|uniref:Fructose-6-phosphate aldolase n=1 Tax=Zooshikella ganghwensis TaxID=202772 RepID=A0A4P9VSY8_9GAMM|nr:transaldolase family protein [Zooshikella ganghwensis]MBU2704905.1 fructose-6-phosphate aldolase [Zooshikella ganghwensis]RDH45342.1 fructose-6-phosphate aldolase [Zooshikella ganghwensis]
MVELYLDSADIEEILSLHAKVKLSGVTTNPTILAKSHCGVNHLLSTLNTQLESPSRFFVQTISATVEGIIAEAKKLHALPYNIVVKVPATEAGLAAIKTLKKDNIPILATAIYTTAQGLLAAHNGADYIAPYVNRIAQIGGDGIGVASKLQKLITNANLSCKILAASFKSVQQVVSVLEEGVKAITLPCDIMQAMYTHPAVNMAVEEFNEHWQSAFAEQLSYET